MKVVDVKKLRKLKQTQYKIQGGAFPRSGFFVNVEDLFMLPVIDTEKVVYCENCKNRSTESCPMTFWADGNLVDKTKAKDFCSYGEELNKKK